MSPFLMNRNSVLITGAAGTLGSSFAESLAEGGEFDLEIADLRAEALEAVAMRTGAVRWTIGDIFDEASHAHRHVTNPDAGVVIWNAAINLDRYEPASGRSELREKQNTALQHLIDSLLKGKDGEVRRRLLVVVNSIAAIFGDEVLSAKAIAEANNWQYGLMKGEQSNMLRENRTALHGAGVDLSVLYPGSFESSFTDVAEALRNANALGKKVRNYRGRANLKQERALGPKEITQPVAALIRFWQERGVLPEHAKEWIMLNSDDLLIDAKLEA